MKPGSRIPGFKVAPSHAGRSGWVGFKWRKQLGSTEKADQAQRITGTDHGTGRGDDRCHGEQLETEGAGSTIRWGQQKGAALIGTRVRKVTYVPWRGPR